MADRIVRLFGRAYRWRDTRVLRGGLDLVPVPVVPEGVKVAEAPPWTPSPCAEWNMRHIARKLAEGADPADA